MTEPPHQRIEITFGNALQIVETDAPRGYSILKITHQGFIIEVEGDAMYTLPVDHYVRMEISYVDAAGNAATVDGDVSWVCSDDTVAHLDVDASDSSIVRVTPLKVGQVQIVATADADLGEGIRELKTPCDIEIVAGEAVAGTISPIGEPVPMGATKKK